jgi:hypothetical protein
MLVATGGACGFKGEAELLRDLWFRNKSALGVTVTPKEVAETAPSLRHLPAVLGTALRTREPRPFERRDVAAWRVIADHFGERFSLGVLWV